jgi:hypothetical protein
LATAALCISDSTAQGIARQLVTLQLSAWTAQERKIRLRNCHHANDWLLLLLLLLLAQVLVSIDKAADGSVSQAEHGVISNRIAPLTAVYDDQVMTS